MTYYKFYYNIILIIIPKHVEFVYQHIFTRVFHKCVSSFSYKYDKVFICALIHLLTSLISYFEYKEEYCYVTAFFRDW